MVLDAKSDRLVEVYRIANANCVSQNRSEILESDVVYAILAIPKSVIGITCLKLGLSTETLQRGVSEKFYPPRPYTSEIERLAIKHFSKHPGILEMILPEHLLFVLSRTSCFKECISKLALDPSVFVSELYRRSGKDISRFPDSLFESVA